jgi:hypothetical protein
VENEGSSASADSKQPPALAVTATGQTKQPESKEAQPKGDGAILMDFLTSLRTSFETAIGEDQDRRDQEQQAESETTNSSDGRLESSSSGNRGRPATVTDTSSQQQESCGSVEDSDWNSEDKKTDRSESSEESDKDENLQQDGYQKAVNYSKGPPRKRHKAKMRASDPSD